MKNSNWPHGTDLGSPNFTGKTPRTSRHQGGGWADDSERIPAAGWIGAIVVVGILLAMMFVGAAVGF